MDAATRDELAEAAASVDRTIDPVATGPGVVYWNPPKGSSTDTPFAKILAKAAYKTRTTNRNLRTLVKIAADRPRPDQLSRTPERRDPGVVKRRPRASFAVSSRL